MLGMGQVNLLPHTRGVESVFAEWKDWVWFDFSRPELRQVKPIDFFGESAVSLYPVPGTHELYYHVIVSSSIYPIACSFAEYLERVFVSRGLSTGVRLGRHLPILRLQ